MSAHEVQLTPLRPMDIDEVLECPPAPRRRSRSASEALEAEAYDAVVRQLVGELTTRLDALPAVEGLVSPSGLQRQQAFDPAAPRIYSPVTMESPAALYVVGAARQVSADLDLAAAAASPLKRRETDIEGDLGAAAADTNTSELSPADEGDEEAESEEEEMEDEVSVSEEEESDGEEADSEGGGDAVEHVEAEAEAEAEATNTGGLYLTFHRQKGTGELALRLEAPVWMVGVLVSVVTAYMWMVVYLIKAR